jgi:hypothetical protein
MERVLLLEAYRMGQERHTTYRSSRPMEILSIGQTASFRLRYKVWRIKKERRPASLTLLFSGWLRNKQGSALGLRNGIHQCIAVVKPRCLRTACGQRTSLQRLEDVAFRNVYSGRLHEIDRDRTLYRLF